MESNLLRVDTSKACITKMADELVQPVMDGIVSALDTFVKIKALEEALADAKKRIEELALDDADKYGKGVFEHMGCKITQRETGVKYDFSQIGGWAEIESKIKDLKDQQKIIETMAKASSPQAPYIDASTGEAIYGVPKTSKTSLVISFK